jgi:hypothetical protein
LSEVLANNQKNKNNAQVSIAESTTDCNDVRFLKSLGLVVLLGTDSHVTKGKYYTSCLGTRGTIIKAKKFNYTTFMQALKDNSFGYFSVDDTFRESINCDLNL